MKGYIGVTSREWFTYFSKENHVREVNFWRKNTNQFQVLSEGEPFFFLVKNEEGIRGERAVLGNATYVRYEVLKVDEAWSKYGNGNGDEDKSSFMRRMNVMFETDKHNGEIGCIILTDFQGFDNPVYLSNIDIEFANSVVSGKSIIENEIKAIIDYGFSTVDDVMRKITELGKAGIIEDEDSFPEGKLKLKQHITRERNPKVIKLAKERHLVLHGRLFCKICDFDFKQHYGDIGEGYIEAHHTKPISEMDDNEETKVDDIALVCANCHSMLHRRRPWLTLSELKRLLQN